jgi:peptide/nickel transport system permease protein
MDVKGSPQRVSRADVLSAPAAPVIKQPLWQIHLSLWWRSMKDNWAIYSENPIGLIGLGIIVLFALMAIAHPILYNTVWDQQIYNPVTGFDYNYAHPAAPSAEHLLGTDPIGRDVVSQLLYSTASEFALGLVAALVTVAIGTSLGAIAAYFGGIGDVLLMRLADIVIMTPLIPLLIVIGALFELNLILLGVVLGILSGFGGVTVIIKSQALSIMVKPYIEAARIAGGGHRHIIATHIIPNLLPLSFLYMMFTVTDAIFSEAVLSFFGLLNIRMSWGIMIHTAQTEGYLLNFSTWWLLFPPSVSITLLCAAFYMVGRALDEVINPRLRRR